MSEEKKLGQNPETQEAICTSYNPTCGNCKRKSPYNHRWVPVTDYCDVPGEGTTTDPEINDQSNQP